MELAILDEVPGTITAVGTAQFSSPKITVGQLIRARLQLEIEGNSGQFDSLRNRYAQAAVVPGERESRLNGDGRASGPGAYFLQPTDDSMPYNIERLCKAAEQGFLRGRYFILLEDRQVESLSEEIDLARTSEAIFLLLTPLKGG